MAQKPWPSLGTDSEDDEVVSSSLGSSQSDDSEGDSSAAGDAKEPAINAGEAAPDAGRLMDSEPEQDTDTDAYTLAGGGKQPAVSQDDNNEELDALNDITDSSDLEHGAVNVDAGWQT